MAQWLRLALIFSEKKTKTRKLGLDRSRSESEISFEIQLTFTFMNWISVKIFSKYQNYFFFTPFFP